MAKDTSLYLGGGAVALLLLFAMGGRRGSSGTPAAGIVDARSAGMIAGLDPAMQPLATAFMRQASAAGLHVTVTDGFRSSDAQAAIYAKGRTEPGPIVTNAPPGSSWHEFGLAFDVAPVDETGRAFWPNDTKFWTWLGELGERLELAWGGRWQTPDWGHFEYHPGVTLAMARAGTRPGVPA